MAAGHVQSERLPVVVRWPRTTNGGVMYYGIGIAIWVVLCGIMIALGSIAYELGEIKKELYGIKK